MKTIFELKREIEGYLEEHPELREFQRQYEEHMAKAGPKPENRLIYFRLFIGKMADNWKWSEE